MNSVKNKAVAFLMTAAVLVCAVLPAGCDMSKAKDTAAIEELTEQFIEAFAAGDSDDVEDLIDGSFRYSYNDKDSAEIMLRLASKTEIESFKSVEVDRNRGTAKARFKVEYIDSTELAVGMRSQYMSKSEYLDVIDDFEDREIKTLSFNYIFDEDEGKWLIKENSAARYKELFSYYYWISIAAISGDEVIEAFEGLFNGLAKGETDQKYYTFDPEEVRVFDDGEFESPELEDAVTEFIKAYYSFIVDHGIQYSYSDDYPYHVTVSGFAPSREQILDYISGDECVTEMYMASIRTTSVFGSRYSEEEVWGQFYAGIYYDLAKQIPYMDGEPYYIELSIDPMGDNPEIYTDFDLFMLSENDVYTASIISSEQELRCRQKAVEALYYAGELNKQQYDSYMYDIERDRNQQANPYAENNSAAKYIDWEGTETHENQAVDVYEYIPEWSDGSLIYGASEIDEEGIFMHYSKEPGWLNTAGYCIGDDGITVMVTYDHKFQKGTELIYDWYIDGENFGDSVKFTVEEDGTVEFEFTLPDQEIRKYGTCELRLWESGHSHVIAYVKLTKT